MCRDVCSRDELKHGLDELFHTSVLLSYFFSYRKSLIDLVALRMSAEVENYKNDGRMNSKFLCHFHAFKQVPN